MSALPLTIPKSYDRNVPRIVRDDPEFHRAMKELREDPDLVPILLTRAAGALLAQRQQVGMGVSAAVLVARLTLFPETDFT